MPPTQQHLSEDHLSILHGEVQALLAKKTIERVPMSEIGTDVTPVIFWCLRPILVLHPLKFFIQKDKYKMLTLAQVLSDRKSACRERV